MFFLAARRRAPRAAATAAAHFFSRHRAIRLADALGLYAVARPRIQQLIHFRARQNLGPAQKLGRPASTYPAQFDWSSCCELAMRSILRLPIRTRNTGWSALAYAS